MTKRRAIALVAAFAAAFRLLYVAEIHDHPYWRTPLVDAADFHGKAMAVARGEGLGAGVYYKAPAYAWLVGQLYRVSGPHLEAAYAVQMLGGVATAVLVALLGAQWFGLAAGLAGGIGTALYAPLPYFENQLLIESGALFFSVVAAFLLFGTISRRSNTATWRVVADLTGGVAVGVALQLRPVNMALVLALLLALLLQPVSWATRARRIACLLVPVLLLLVPTLRHNRVATGRIVPISVNGGINFYIGNNPDYDATVAIRPGLRWEELTARFDSMNDPVRWQENFYDASLTWMRQHPRAAAQLFIKKAVVFWNRIEIDRNQDSGAMRGDSRVLRCGVPWSLLAPLGLVGFVGVRNAWRRLPLHLLFGLQALGVVAFFVTSRYRMAVVPWLAIAAGIAIQAMAAAIRTRDRRGAARLAVAILAAAILVMPGWYGIAHQDFGRPDFERAEVLARHGDREAALAAYNKAAVSHPDDPDVRFRRGEQLARLGQRDAAIVEYERATELAPWSYKPPLALGAAQIESGHLEAAWTALEVAARRGDPHGTTQYDMGLVRERQQRYAEALPLYRQSLERPDQSAEMIRRRLAVARMLLVLAQPEAAEVEFAAALRAGADSAQVESERRAAAAMRSRHLEPKP